MTETKPEPTIGRRDRQRWFALLGKWFALAQETTYERALKQMVKVCETQVQRATEAEAQLEAAKRQWEKWKAEDCEARLAIAIERDAWRDRAEEAKRESGWNGHSAKEWSLALQGLTAQGSEFASDPKACVDYVRRDRTNAMETRRRHHVLLMEAEQRGRQEERKRLRAAALTLPKPWVGGNVSWEEWEAAFALILEEPKA